MVFAVVYAAAYVSLINLLHPMLEGASTAWINFVEAAVPTLVGTAVCCFAWLLPEKRMMLSAYLWLAVLAVACLVAMLIILGGDSRAQMLFCSSLGCSCRPLSFWEGGCRCGCTVGISGAGPPRPMGESKGL
jgi:hypothetical protein